MNKSEKYPFQYYTFPNNFCILSLIKNADLEITGNEVFIKRSEKDQQISSLTNYYTSQMKVNYLDSAEEFTIYFKPNGINHFIDNMMDFYNSRSMESFEPFYDFKPIFFKIFDFNEREIQIDFFEEMMLALFKEKKEELIENLINDIDSELSIEEIARKNKISRQYLNQYFKLKIGKSPSDFRKISRFRKSLHSLEQKEKSLTEVSYENLFFDQSHFNKDFKSLTKFNPKEFLSKTDLGKQNIWFII
jgi:AraC-like DNA-binding protein